jgi:3-hydroxyisobutyrate dehydrogenase/glyoxylate/succinic semialdehyde reductase
VDLETTRWLADGCAGVGADFLDAPFTGSREAAAAGALVYYLGGDERVVARVGDFLSVTSRAVLPCGPVGAATVVKLATNLVSACTVQALSEALAIATRNGVDAGLFTRAVAENACGSPLAAMKLPGMSAGDFETHFSLSNMAKDSRYARVLAREAGVESPAIDAVSARMHELADAGLGGFDYSVLAKPYL